MRVLIDTCVLYPTIMREIVLGVADAGLFTPLWSHRILDEWAHSAMRNHPTTGGADVEIALVKANWPNALVSDEQNHPDLWLPDENDVHVLQAAINANANELLTANRKDFPTRILSAHGIIRRDPDGFLLEFAQNHFADVSHIVSGVMDKANSKTDTPQDMRAILKRARLPRLGKFMVSTM